MSFELDDYTMLGVLTYTRCQFIQFDKLMFIAIVMSFHLSIILQDDYMIYVKSIYRTWFPTLENLTLVLFKLIDVFGKFMTTLKMKTGKRWLLCFFAKTNST